MMEYQEGGAVDPMEEIVGAAVQIAQGGSCEEAMQLVQALAQMGAPVEAPAFKKGGKLVKKKKEEETDKKGAKMTYKKGKKMGKDEEEDDKSKSKGMKYKSK